MLLVAEATWLADNKILGCCHFRRTWSNNLYVDFLAVNPLVLNTGSEARVVGVGTGLLFNVAEVALAIGAKQLWGEATRLSSGFYQKTLGIPRVDDMFRVSLSQLRRFKHRFLGKWKPHLKILEMNSHRA